VSGRPRTSTVVLTGLFLAVLALYILVRPVPAPAASPGPAASPASTASPARSAPSPTRSASPSHTPRTSRSPTPATSPTSSHHPPCRLRPARHHQRHRPRPASRDPCTAPGNWAPTTDPGHRQLAAAQSPWVRKAGPLIDTELTPRAERQIGARRVRGLHVSAVPRSRVRSDRRLTSLHNYALSPWAENSLFCRRECFYLDGALYPLAVAGSCGRVWLLRLLAPRSHRR